MSSPKGTVSTACHARRAVKPPRHIHWAVWTLAVLASALAVASALSVWAKRQALDEQRVGDSTTKLLENSKVRGALATFLVDELYCHLDVAGELRRWLPKNLRVLADPVAFALRPVVDRSAYELLGTSPVIRLVREATLVAHAEFLDVVYDRGRKVDVVYLELRPVVLALASRVGLERQVVQRLPPDAGRFELLNPRTLDLLRTSINTVRVLSIFLVILIAALYAGAIAVARGWRRHALLRCGLGLLSAAVVILVLRRAGQTVVLDRANVSPDARPGAAAAYGILTDILSTIAWSALAVALSAVVFAWLAGPAQPAHSIRRALAPAFVRHPAIVWILVGLAIAGSFALVPVADWSGLVARLVGIAVVGGGLEMLRRLTKREHPDGGWTWERVEGRR